jgi:hypothetical protein
MAQFGLRYRVDVVFIGDGQGGMEVANSQVLSFFPSSNNPLGLSLGNPGNAQAAAPVPGGASPTLANFTTALNDLATDIEAQLTPAVIARIQAFATGSG